jgi:hypothetical protein
MRYTFTLGRDGEGVLLSRDGRPIRRQRGFQVGGRIGLRGLDLKGKFSRKGNKPPTG